MRKRKPLIDDDGEVRELLMEDIRRFRPAAEVLPPALAEKLGVRLRDKGQGVAIPNTPWYRDKIRKRDAAEGARAAATDPKEERKLRARRDRYRAMITMGPSRTSEASRTAWETRQGSR